MKNSCGFIKSKKGLQFIPLTTECDSYASDGYKVLLNSIDKKIFRYIDEAINENDGLEGFISFDENPDDGCFQNHLLSWIIRDDDIRESIFDEFNEKDKVRLDSLLEECESAGGGFRPTLILIMEGSDNDRDYYSLAEAGESLISGYETRGILYAASVAAQKKMDLTLIYEAWKENGWTEKIDALKNFESKKNTIKNRKKLVESFKNKPDKLEKASDELRNDREIVLSAVTEDGYALQHASDELRNDREIVLKAVANSGDAIRFVSDELRNDREIALAAISKGGSSFGFLSDELRNDREIVLKAVAKSGSAIRYVSDELRNDREIVLKAVANSGDAIRFVSDELRNDRDVVLAALTEDGYPLQYASDELRNDREIVLKAVANVGIVLQHASDELRNDRDVVLTAVTQDGYALQHSSDELKNDREVVLMAIDRQWYAIQYASKELQIEFDYED